MSETKGNSGTGDSEARGLASILLWSQDCCGWQRDALRRLTIGELGDADLAELIALCKKRSLKAVPLASEHAPDSKAATLTVTLRCIEAVENVNALAEKQRLTFEKSGVTVIYGDNGSGKSGYIRVLKKVCRVRSSKDEKIVSNIYASKTGPQKARIGFTVNGNNHDAPWENVKIGDPRLSSISIFDSSAASVHVDQTNNVAYTPFPMKVLEDLAQLCQVIKQRLTAEIEAIEKQTPAAIKTPECRSQTTVGKLIAQLDGRTRPETIRALATLSETEKTRLQTLKTDLASDPAKTARTLSAQKLRLDNHLTGLEVLQASVAEGQGELLTQLYRKYQTAKQASAAAAGDLFGNDPLPAIGSEVWRVLWEAARTYSQQQAYPAAVFPFTADGARCVLCQQELDEEAADRLVRFESFIKDESKRREQNARDIYEDAVQKLRAGDVSFANLRAIVAIVRDELNDAVLAAQVRKSTLTAKWRLRHILRAHKLWSPPPVPTFEALPSQALAAYSADLETRASALMSESTSEDRKKFIAECEELTDRQWLSLVQEDVIAEVGRRGEIAALRAALEDTKTNRITTKSAELAEDLVTNALRAQFTKEVDKLGVAGLAIELRKDRSSYGTPLFRVSLIKKPDARVGEILSEGEHRCVAIAAFLAELSTTESRSTLVFDDPVSSLDHMHRENLAKRFAAEGQNRQILVFTHDIAFLFLLNEACHEQQTHIGFRCITRGTDLAGYCHLNAPMNAQPVDKVIESMQKQLDNQKIQHQQGNQEEWYKTVRSLQEQLRTTWERAVEEVVGPVLKRLANKVDTKGLAKLTAVELKDCKTMRKAFGRCSKLLHSSSEVLNPPLPAPDAIQNEITVLLEWTADIKARQDKIETV